MSGKVFGLLDGLDDLMGDRSTFRYEVKKLHAVYEWARVRAGADFTEGDRVVLTDDAGVSERSSGWWPYREALSPGATAVVQGVDYNEPHGYWYADIVLDREWSIIEFRGPRQLWHGPIDATPDGFDPPGKYDAEHYPEGRKHTFAVPVEWITSAGSGEDEG